MKIYENDQLVEITLSELQQKIMEQCLYDPNLNNAMKLWKYGHCTYEEALSQAVFYLVQQNKQLVEKLVKYKMIYG
jgi:hypothetical protein